MIRTGHNTPSPEAEGLRILCFDGGGVRGKASLLMLKEIMDYIGQGVKPCDFFDLIAGTSTGSLIAIMLARLRYSADEAIKKYDELGPRIFSNVDTPRKWILHGTPVVNEGSAEKVFREIGLANNEDALMDSGDKNPCKCFVTTVLQDHPEILIPIRSYQSADRVDPVICSGNKWKIWQAARAATAAPVYFKPLEIGGRKFIDAGTGYNNPSIEVFHETKKIPEYKGRCIACFVSIGTGVCESRPAPGTSERNESIFGSLPSARDIQDRASALIQYLSTIASAPNKVHQEMQRSFMENGPYFRFDPGHVVGSIDLTDVSKLQKMEDFVWNHINTHDTVKEDLQRCAETLMGASFAAVQALRLAQMPPDIVPISHPSRPSIQGDWQNVTTLVESILKDPDSVPTFLAVFSLSNNFNRVMEELDTLYCRSPLSDTSDTQSCILGLVATFVSHLWLTDPKIGHFEALIPKSIASAPSFAWAAWSLGKSLEKLKKENENAATIQDPIASLDDTSLPTLAEELAKALAVLEDELRRTDPTGECIRWLARVYPRDFLSFPERVEMWVLQSIILCGEPEQARLRYKLFYRVAKRSKDIHNISAMRAIVSALYSLEQIRKKLRVKTTDLELMKRLGYEAGKHDAEKARRKDKPYLRSLPDILRPKFTGTIDVSTIADARNQIHWGRYQAFFRQVEEFTSHNRLTSEHRYVFAGDRVAWVKMNLIHVESVGNLEGQVADTIRKYEKARVPPPLFRSSSQRS